MLDLGPHSAFIIWSYALTAAVVSALIAWVTFDERRQKRVLAELESRGIKRRSDAQGVDDYS